MSWTRSRDHRPGRRSAQGWLVRADATSGAPAARRLLLLAAIVGALAGCNGPCDALADQACTRLGDAAPTCVALRARTASPANEDRMACNAGEAFAHELQRSR